MQLPYEEESRFATPKGVEPPKIMAHFYIYADESGKLATNDYTSFCGYVGPALEFERVMVEWNICRFSWGVPPIHMRLVMYPERDKSGRWQKIRDAWGVSWEERRWEMLKQFASIIANSSLVSVGSVVDAAHFKTLGESRFKKDMKNPIFMSLYLLLMNSIDRIDSINTSLPISIIIDDDEEYAMQCYQFITAMKSADPATSPSEILRVRQRISAITFANDDSYPALQMADMIAYEARAEMVSRLSDKYKNPSMLYIALTKKMLHQINLCTAEILDKMQREYPNVQP